MGPKQTTEETRRRRLGSLLRISELLLQIGNPLLRTVQAQILDQYRLGKIVGAIRLIGHGLANQRLGLGILGLTAGAFQAREQGGDQVVFLGCHQCLTKSISAGDPSGHGNSLGRRGRWIDTDPPAARPYDRPRRRLPRAKHPPAIDARSDRGPRARMRPITGRGECFFASLDPLCSADLNPCSIDFIPCSTG